MVSGFAHVDNPNVLAFPRVEAQGHDERNGDVTPLETFAPAGLAESVSLGLAWLRRIQVRRNDDLPYRFQVLHGDRRIAQCRDLVCDVFLGDVERNDGCRRMEMGLDSQAVITFLRYYDS